MANVDYQDLIYQKANPYLLKMRHVVDGTETIRANKTTYLKRYDGETDTSYSNRVDTSEWNDATGQTIDDSRDKIFRKELNYTEEVPEDFWKVIDNADGNGANLNEWAKQFVPKGIQEGLAYIFVDYPEVPRGLTQADYEALSPQPTFSTVMFSDVINRIIDDKGRLVQATISEKVTVQKDRFEQEEVVQYRVLFIDENDVYMELYMQTDDGIVQTKEPTVITPIKNGKKLLKLPLIPFYTGKEGFHNAKPPLNELANLSITWYNKRSQYSRALRISADPTLKRWGMTNEEQQQGGKLSNRVGVNAVYNFNGRKDENDVEWFTPNIQSLEEMRTDLAEKAAITERNQIAMTATQAGMESADKTSKLSNWAISLQNALNSAKEYALWLMNIDDGGEIVVNTDFDEMTITAQDAQEYRNEVITGTLSQETYQQIMVLAERRPPEFEIDAEVERLRTQQP